jgi:MbtH protein
MNMIHENTDTVYKVVINDEEQYSLWPLDRPNPPGWTDADKQGSYQECLDHIEEGFKGRVATYIERSQSRGEAPWTRSARTARVST